MKPPVLIKSANDPKSTEKESPKSCVAKPVASAAPKPGVIASILEFLSTATKEKPVNKATLCDKLAKRFPERLPDSMMKTINVQVPNRIQKERKLQVKQNEAGFWIEKQI